MHSLQVSNISGPVILPRTPFEAERAAELAGQLHLEVVFTPPADSHLYLLVTGERLELRQSGPKAPGPVYAEFTTGPIAFRRARGGGLKQHLARAVGLKGPYRPTVLDATAGLGRDAFILAALGCRVVMCERNPLIAALLADALQRARSHPEVGPIITHRLTLHSRDARQWLALSASRPEVIYLDPMYPVRSKTALAKKEMRLLRRVAGSDADAVELFAAAVTNAVKRVVVKRPRLSAPLSGRPPDLVVAGRSSRFDIYLTNQ